jgi:elongator complex protein 2
VIQSKNSMHEDLITCRLLHHGAAASPSSPKAVICIPPTNVPGEGSKNEVATSSELIYSNDLMLNICSPIRVPLYLDNNKEDPKLETVWKVTHTLRTNTSTEAETATAAANVSTLTAKRVITCVAHLKQLFHNTKKRVLVIVCGFSDGSMTCWRRFAGGEWNESVLPELNSSLEGRSITDIDGLCCDETGDKLSLVACSSGGAHYFGFEGDALVKEKRIIQTPSNVVKYHVLNSEVEKTPQALGLFLVGTAAPRHNKIHVLVMPTAEIVTPTSVPDFAGSLTGHEDWITCLDWTPSPSLGACYSFLASGSQDAKIRLWKWVTTSSSEVRTMDDFSLPDTTYEIAEEEEDDEDEEIIEGEARLEIPHGKKYFTSVYLEALLIGHEEMVTSLAWHPNAQSLYNQEFILVSCSMDRTIFVWSSTSTISSCNDVPNGDDLGGVWTPIARVGSAGGILGGSIGSSLLGFLNVKIEPRQGRWIMGHAYGGALHFFSCEKSLDLLKKKPTRELNDLTIEARASLIQWKAQLSVTGHFNEVTDLCWEAENGQYLITVSNDQTCRVWAPLRPSSVDVWIEIARPQVHGYNISTVTSLSTRGHKHFLVTGADEKELRAFDATQSFLRTLRLISRQRSSGDDFLDDDFERVERAYIPALGLTNKATAADRADEDAEGASASSTILLLEQDLGSTSLWPEVRKLYGHNSEITRLTSTLSSRTCLSIQYLTPYFNELLVASSTKARGVEAANIRLWDVEKSSCVQVLKGGHRSTVTALSFSPDGTYLASSGKDRRLCIWKRQPTKELSDKVEPFFLAMAVDSSHKRIVWSVHFCPYAPNILASGSRDGTLKLWMLTEENTEDETKEMRIKEYLQFSPVADGNGTGGKSTAVTSLAFAPLKLGANLAMLAIGLENGLIQLWSVPLKIQDDSSDAMQATLVSLFDPNMCHIGAISKLAWRPTSNNGIKSLTLASCSLDSGCRLFDVQIC